MDRPNITLLPEDRHRLSPRIFRPRLQVFPKRMTRYETPTFLSYRPASVYYSSRHRDDQIQLCQHGNRQVVVIGLHRVGPMMNLDSVFGFELRDFLISWKVFKAHKIAVQPKDRQ